MAIPNDIIPVNMGKEMKKGRKGKSFFFFFYFRYDPAINIRIISYLLTKKEKKGKERDFFFFFYDSAINIHVFVLGN